MHEDAIIKTCINLSLLFQISDVWWRFALIKTRIKEKMKKTQYLLHANITSCTVLQGHLHYKDTAKYMDELDPASAKNAELYNRNLATQNRKPAELEGVLFTDICQQQRYILDGVQINLEFWQSKDAFRILSDDITNSLQVKVVDAVLKVCTVRVTPNVLIAISEVLKIKNALYPYKRSVIKSFSIPEGQYSFNVDDIFQGEVPLSLCVGVVSAESYNGSYKQNPFNFQNFNCSYVSFNIDGQRSPLRPLQLNFVAENYTSAFYALVDMNKFPSCFQYRKK